MINSSYVRKDLNNSAYKKFFPYNSSTSVLRLFPGNSNDLWLITEILISLQFYVIVEAESVITEVYIQRGTSRAGRQW